MQIKVVAIISGVIALLVFYAIMPNVELAIQLAIIWWVLSAVFLVFFLLFFTLLADALNRLFRTKATSKQEDLSPDIH